MAILIRDTMRPKNASCGWSTACDFWRYSGAVSLCPDKAYIQSYDFNAAMLITFAGSDFGYAYSAGIRTLCAGSSGYVTVVSALRVEIDIWKALADGVWSSSLSVPIMSSRSTATTHSSRVEPAGSNPALQFVTKSAVVNPGCTMSANITCTFYDDGTFTLS